MSIRCHIDAKSTRGIPIAHSSYQALIEDPTLNAVYIALPSSLYFEWAMKTLNAGKRVLLEKRSTSRASETHSLFRSPLLAKGEGPSLQAGKLVGAIGSRPHFVSSCLAEVSLHHEVVGF